MRFAKSARAVATLGVVAALFVSDGLRAEDMHDGLRLTPLRQQAYADLPGKEGLMLLVEYAPGRVDELHRHDAHVFVYVLEGSIEMQVAGGKRVTLKPGETFYEGPQDVHVVGRNASKTKPAKFLAIFLKNQNTPPVLPVTKN